MHKKRIITLAGKPGSGKSTTAKLLASTLNYDHFSSGDLFREIARKRGQNVKEANIDAESKELDAQNIDQMVDSRLREIGKQENNKVIDSRTAWHWIPSAFKVYLDLDTIEAARRIIGSMKAGNIAHSRNEHIPESIETYSKELNERLGSESRRYLKLYEIDPYDIKNHDFVVDTGSHSAEEVVQQILKAYDRWLRE